MADDAPPSAETSDEASENLDFVVAPHIVQDLGLNLYTTLPRVLVEFVANAHDADAGFVDVQMDFDAIRSTRREIREAYDEEDEQRLEEVELPDDLRIRVTDDGHGMSRKEVQKRFLIAGRRRREEEKTVRSPGKRILMGRKGLGKLAGFGVGRRVTVTSTKKGESYATRVILDYDALISGGVQGKTPVPTEERPVEEDDHGTEIVLDRLVFEPVKSRRTTVERELGNHFRFVGSEDFEVRVNGSRIPDVEEELAYAWPDPESLDISELKGASVEVGHVTKPIRYRIRFTEKSLKARDRGCRIYASGRLASAPDLLDLPTGMHGFRLTDYIDGIAIADFIDQAPAEYIATDRTSLRWETHFLRGLREFLTNEMRDAVKAYQKKRDQEAEKEAKEDQVTQEIIAKARLSAARQRTAMRLAGELAKTFPEGPRDPDYPKFLEILAQGLGQGTVLETLAKLARQEIPGFGPLTRAIVELTTRESGELARYAEGKVSAIKALRRIVQAVDFRDSNREKDVQELFEKAPFLIDPIFTKLVSGNEWLDTTFERLAQHLKIREFATPNDSTRPDLVFLVMVTGGEAITIVELKAANETLNIKHLNQLERYMRKAEEFLAEHGKGHVKVRGLLIGSRRTGSASEDVKDLNRRIEMNVSEPWEVRDLIQVLESAKLQHEDLLEVYRRIEADSEDSSDPSGDGATK